MLDEFEIEGQDPSRGSGVLGMAMDAEGVLYIVDRYPQRIVALDPNTGEQWDYATFSQVRDLCVPGPVLVLATQCAYADDLAFTPDGTLFVTDVAQNLIWRVPPGGGEAEEWFTDTRILSPFGPNGIEVMADGKTLMFAQTMTGPLDTLGNLLRGEPTLPATGKIFTLTVNDDGSPRDLETFWESEPGIGLDGIAIAESGNVYAALGLGSNSVVAISPEGEEIKRNPANEVENLLLEVPLDTPGSMKFLGDRLLVTNHAPFVAMPGAFVVFDVYTGERGLDPFRPQLPSR
ncbi:SMP-30/gluconolactonase/LRE family protein [Amycolatopsis marina]|uniref:SMP-30/gluconolactonase/LRE family protein n=1 Tax=Amycolatopsis marina TaxID=490629 RepID=UPI000B80EBE8|nr:SMP-30/gluconolactonase/LRE family protein [Amycolatopsis marina]